MNALSWGGASAPKYCQSAALRKSLATICDGVFVRIDVGGARLLLKASAAMAMTGPTDLALPRSAAARVDTAPGDIVSLELLTPDASDLPPLAEDGGGISWVAFECTLSNGAVDQIFLRLRGDLGDIHVESILKAVWPVLRVDCIKELQSPEAETAISAMLWTVSKKTDSAIFVLNTACEVQHVNAAGREMLETKEMLRETSSGLTCSASSQTIALHKAVRACAIETAQDTDFILLLDSADGTARVPVSLSRHQASRTSQPLVVAIVPQQPDRRRIEQLALTMGLTQSEARVAALMQMGLPNREAARVAGLKEQTFSTYSKRVLAKLNVSCRAEMAHMLTWQGSLGRVS